MRRALLLLALVAGTARAQLPPGADGPLTLEQAVAAALAHQPQLAGARAQVRAAQARTTQATSGLLPQVSGTAHAGTSNTTTTSVTLPGGATSTVTSGGQSWSFHLDASQALFDAGTWMRASASRASADAQARTEQATLATVVLNVRSAWFSASAARDLVAVAKDSLANKEQHLKQVQGFVEVGTRPEIDLAQARADRANARVVLISAENGLATSHAQLNQAMGVVAGTDYPLAPDTFGAQPGEDASIETLMQEALAARPDVAAQQKVRDAQQATLRAAQAGYLPTVGANGQIAETGPRADDTRRSWNAGLTLTWPLFQGFQTRGQTAEAEANLDAVDATLEALRQQVRLEVEQAQLGVRAAKASLEATHEASLNTRELLRLAEARYQAGLGNAIELSDAQVSATNAAAQEVQARFTLSSARAQLARALGRS